MKRILLLSFTLLVSGVCAFAQEDIIPKEEVTLAKPNPQIEPLNNDNQFKTLPLNKEEVKVKVPDEVQEQINKSREEKTFQTLPLNPGEKEIIKLNEIRNKNLEVNTETKEETVSDSPSENSQEVIPLIEQETQKPQQKKSIFTLPDWLNKLKPAQKESVDVPVETEVQNVVSDETEQNIIEK